MEQEQQWEAPVTSMVVVPVLVQFGI